MQRGVGQHDTKIIIARGNLIGNRVRCLFSQQHNRPPDGGQQLFLFTVDGSIAANGRKIGGHDGKGLFLANFPSAQAPDRIGIGGIGRQMISAKPLDRQNITLFQEFDGFSRSDRVCQSRF